MNLFLKFNPRALFIYFLSITVCTMFSSDLFLIFISLSGGIVSFSVLPKTKHMKTHLIFIFMFVLLSLINPIFSKNGSTVLFVFNDSPVTLESLFYGVFASALTVCVLYFATVFSRVITSDGLIYIFSFLGNKIALTLSMAFRFVPLLSRKTSNARSALKVTGGYNDDSILSKIQSELAVFYSVFTECLELGIISADSMEARGYGTKRRTSFSLYSFKLSDAFLILFSLLTLVMVFVFKNKNVFYPVFIVSSPSILSVISYILYFILVFFLPLCILGEKIKWKYLMSKI